MLPACSSTANSTPDIDDQYAEEERDAFVARWYKYREDKGDPANSTPRLGKCDVDLYGMYRCVKRRGGWNRVEKAGAWPHVLTAMGLQQEAGVNAAMLRKCYKR